MNLPMDLSVSGLLAGLVFSSLGVYFFRIAKKDANLRMMLLGVALFFYPYFIYNPWACWGIGIVLTIMAFKSVD